MTAKFGERFIKSDLGHGLSIHVMRAGAGKSEFIQYTDGHHVDMSFGNALEQVDHRLNALCLASDDILLEGMFSGPPCTSKFLQPALACM